MSDWHSLPSSPDLPDPFPIDPDLPIPSEIEIFADRYPLFWSVFGPDAPAPNSAAPAGPDAPEDALLAEVPPALEGPAEWDFFLDALG
jgi:hypothetical protein